MSQTKPTVYTVLVYLDPSLPAVEKPPIKKLVEAFLKSAKYGFGTYQLKLRRCSRCDHCHTENTILIKEGEYLQVLGVEVRLRGEKRSYHGQLKFPNGIIKRPAPQERNVSGVGVVTGTTETGVTAIASDKILDLITELERNCRATIQEMQGLYLLPKKARSLSNPQIHHAIGSLQAMIRFAAQARTTRIAQIQKRGQE